MNSHGRADPAGSASVGAAPTNPTDMDSRTEDRLEREEMEGRKQQAGGAFDEMKGKIKKNVGDAIDDHSMQAKGAAQEAAGKARKHAGDARADAADAAEDRID